MSKQEDFVTWTSADSESKKRAISSLAGNVEYYGDAYKASAYHGRDFKNIEPNTSVRPGYSSRDYYAFRPNEAIPQNQKQAIAMCMEAYNKVGIIRNVIDLMGDFGSQGIEIVHESKSVEKFYQQWFKKVDGKERSERFLNNLYRTGNVLMYRSYAQMTPPIVQYMRSAAEVEPDIMVEVPEFERNMIPWRYNILNPMSVESKDGELNMYLGRKNFQIDGGAFLDNFKDGTVPSKIFDTLPPEIKKAIKAGSREITLDPEKLSVFYYKKDDWNQWANPMIYAILDDISMLEKMRLADRSALDGAISNIRLWTLGDLEHKILPNAAAINKLRDILANNVGGGTMELVWGPELSYTESNSQVYKFLGSEKYNSVLNSIYAGMGVPPTLTGMAGNGGGFTNNFISLKTLVERLQYGRTQLTKFWEHEVEIVRKAMGIRKSPHVIYDQMSLTDDTTEKNLLIQLLDRNVISNETVLERFKETPEVERTRLQREAQARNSERLPEKASPYHNPQHKEELEKIGLQGSKLMPEDVGLTSTMPKESIIPPSPKQLMKIKQSTSPNADPKGGRPANKQDTKKRKKRKESPRSRPGVADLIVWTQDAFQVISDITNAAYLDMRGKSNLRKLTKAEVSELEALKINILSNTELMQDISSESIHAALKEDKPTPQGLSSYLTEHKIDTKNMPIDEYKKHVVGAYVEFVSSDPL